MDPRPPFRPGETVRLLRLEDSFFDGIEAADAERLRSLVGREWTVGAEKPEFGVTEIVFAHPPRGTAATPLDWVSVPPAWIERID